MTEPAPTRRSSRRQTAESAVAPDEESATPEIIVEVPAAPLSRRALRAQNGHVAAPAAAAEAAVLQRATRRSARASASVIADEDAAELSASAADASVADASVAGASAEPARSADEDADAFVAASAAFSALHSAPEQQPGPGPIAEPRETPVVPTRRDRSRSRKLVAGGATLGIMGVAGMLAVSMTLPPGAVAAAQGDQTSVATSLIAGAQRVEGMPGDDEEIQAYVSSSDVQNDLIEREGGFSTTSLIDLAAQQGIAYSDEVYSNDPDAAIQWPFVVGVGMSYGYGMRDGRLHEGLDLVPGDGAPVQAIAGGTVRIATESGGNYGVTVYIDHMIDGALITSHYSHMQYGSLQVEAGQIVEVGDIIGKVGNTGRSYGAHMHFELIVDGSTIDPLPWLNENAGRYDGVAPVS